MDDTGNAQERTNPGSCPGSSQDGLNRKEKATWAIMQITLRQGTGDAGKAKAPKHAVHIAKKGEKRGLPVAWGQDIFLKCPRLAQKFQRFSQPRPPEREDVTSS